MGQRSELRRPRPGRRPPLAPSTGPIRYVRKPISLNTGGTIGSAHTESSMGELTASNGVTQRAVSAEDTDASSHLRSAARFSCTSHVRLARCTVLLGLQILRYELLGADYTRIHTYLRFFIFLSVTALACPYIAVVMCDPRPIFSRRMESHMERVSDASPLPGAALPTPLCRWSSRAAGCSQRPCTR